ncbi:MAG: sensor histidine kinase [Blastocatellia bacterium]
MIAAARIALALLSLLLISLDPREPDHQSVTIYAILILYIVYSVAWYVLVLYQRPFFVEMHNQAHWADIGWSIILVAFSAGNGLPFIKGFYFPILVASLRRGFVAGLVATLVSAGLLVTIGPLTHPQQEFALNSFLNRSANLLVLGFLLAYAGGTVDKLRGQITLLNDLTSLSNPRLGADHVIGSMMERLRQFFGGREWLLIARDQSSSDYHLRRPQTRDSLRAARTETFTGELGARLMWMPSGMVVVYNAASRGWWRLDASYFAFDPAKSSEMDEGRAASEKLAPMLEADSFMTVPFDWRHGAQGRLYLTSHRRFKRADVDFLLRAIGQTQPLIEHIRLMDRLTSSAAEEERRRIARDIHDSVIQPYIGLQIGLTALTAKLVQGQPDALGDARQLVALTTTGIADLRRYVSALREGHGREGEILLAIRRFATTFSEVTGIEVQVRAESEIRIADRLADEAFQIVVEGLSNIRRHTQSRRAAIELFHSTGCFRVVIENEGETDATFTPFLPRSIDERAAALGGEVRVEQDTRGNTRVSVEIPI